MFGAISFKTSRSVGGGQLKKENDKGVNSEIYHGLRGF